MAEIDEYYKRQKEQLEQEKLNAAIQLNNARQDAMKNTQNYLRGSGYGSQGYGASQMINTNNAYNNQLGNNQNDYWSKLQELNAQQNQARQQEYTSNFENFSNSAGAFDDDSFYTQGQAYGLFKQDNTGKWQIDTENDAYKNLSLANQNALKGLVQNHENNVNSTNIGKTKFGTDGNVSYVDVNGNYSTDTIDKKFKLETNALNSALAGGKEIKNGSAIEMTNEYGDRVFLQYRNGELYYVDKNTYENEKNQFEVRNGKVTNVKKGVTDSNDVDFLNDLDKETQEKIEYLFSRNSNASDRKKDRVEYSYGGKNYVRIDGVWHEKK